MKKTGLIAGLSFLAGAVFFALGFGFLRQSGPDRFELSQDVARAENLPAVSSGPNFVPIVRKVKPAVVQVIAESIVESQPYFGDDFFDQFFNMPRRRQRQAGVGSGFFISSDGFILTNNHVVADSVKIRVTTVEEKEYTARIVGTDPKTDLALIKIDIKDAPFIDLGDSDRVDVGEWVLAIGNPLNQKFTVTAGIISAEHRELGFSNENLEDFLQTDAAINQGNSGGPLINMRGEAIGINSNILTPNSGNIGIGFAIPSNLAKKVVKDLKTKGKVTRGWFGISMQYINEKQAKELDQPASGAMVMSVEENSPAQRAGLQRYDLIVEVNGKPLKSGTDLRKEIAMVNPGDTVEVTLFRNSKKMSIKVRVGEAPQNSKIRGGEGDSRSLDLGMILEKNTPAMARELELKTREGIVVTRVTRGGMAAEQGIRQGDVILEVNRTPITSVEQFERLMSQKQPGTAVLFLVNRYGDEQLLRFYIPEE